MRLKQIWQRRPPLLGGPLSEEEIERIAFRPPYDHGCPRSIYSGPSGPIVTIARITRNVSLGRPAGEGIAADALNDPNAP